MNLEQAVANGSFRQDLFYRLHVLPVTVPSLAERRDDVRELASAFCELASTRHGLDRRELSRSALRAIETAEWPGNVRQLEHAIEAAAIRAAGDASRQIERAHVFPEERGPVDAGDPSDLTFQQATRRFQALSTVDLAQAHQTQTGPKALLGMRAAEQDRLHQLGGGGPSFSGPLDQARRRPLQILLVCLGHVL